MRRRPSAISEAKRSSAASHDVESLGEVERGVGSVVHPDVDDEVRVHRVGPRSVAIVSFLGPLQRRLLTGWSGVHHAEILALTALGRRYGGATFEAVRSQERGKLGGASDSRS